MQIKPISRKIAFLLALIFIAGTITVTPVFAAGNPTSFYSSFETDGDPVPLANTTVTADGITSQSLGSYIGAGGSGGGSVRIAGDLMKCVAAVTDYGSGSGSSSEGVSSLADNTPGTKWCWNSSLTFSNNNVWARYEMVQPYVATTYLLCTAGDNNSYSGRRPTAWKVQGSNDNSNWTTLDTRTGMSLTGNNQDYIYTFDNTTAYLYYRWTLDQVNSSTSATMFQIADWSIGTGTGGQVEPPVGPVTGTMITQTVSPSIKWNSISSNGYTGKRALGAAAKHTKAGRVYGKNVIYEFGAGDEILVTPTTDLSYIVAPSFNEIADAMNNEFGRYPSQHVSLDLRFTNGKYLSELNCYDSHGVLVNPQAQFEGECLWEGMWNKVIARIGDVANGLLIDQILVSYDNKDGENGWSFEAYFDDIRITEKRSDDPTIQPFDSAFNAAGEIIHPSDLVDIRRGSNSSGGTFSRGNQGADTCTPFGFNFWAPQTSVSGSDPYMWKTQNNTTANLPVLRSFASNHRASRWVGDCGNWQFLPNIEATQSSTTMATGTRGYQFSHDNEVAKPYYYSVRTVNDMFSEISPTNHGIHARITFPSGATTRNITFDALGTSSRQISGLTTADNELSFSVTNTHNSSQTMYVYVWFNVTPTNPGGTAISGLRGGTSYASFANTVDVVEMRAATSYISIDQAKANCDLEVKATFNETKAATQKEWDDLMRGTLIKDFAPTGWNGNVDTLPLKTLDGLVTFYSNVYKLCSYPTAQHENIGTNAEPVYQYRTPYGGTLKSGVMYYNNGFWDTYKATWSVYGFLYPKWSVGGLNGLVAHYMDSGFVPRWSAPAGTNSMVGTSSDVVFGTAAVRGQSFDIQRAYESAVKNATVNNTGNLTNGGRDSLTTAIFIGYNPGTGSSSDKLSWGLESYVNDWGVSQMAKQLGYIDQAAYFAARATNYINYWNTTNINDVFYNKAIPGGWLRQLGAPNATTGVKSWASSFNPYSWLNGYTETNAWDMVVTMVDGQGMDNLLKESGGSLEKRLDDVFTTTASFYGGGYGIIHEGREHSAVKMGQYGHSNQPSHQIPYYYNFTSAPWKTQLYVREILDRLYTGWEIGYGYSGDEDNGEMSGTAVMSALGFGSVSLGWSDFYITAPYFPHIVITRDDGTVIDIKAPGVSMTNKYIQSMKLNGVPYNKTYITSKDLYGLPYNSLEFVMGPEPSNWGTSADSKPNSLTAPGVTPQPMVDLSKGYTNRTSEGDAIITGGGTISNSANLFDNSMTTNATATFAEDMWFGYQFATPKVVHLYTISSSNTPATAPRSWVLEASNDGTNWDILDTRTNVTFGFDTRALGSVGTAITKEQALTQGTVWTACGSSFAQNNTQSTMPFGITNTKAYTQYRVRVTAIQSGTSINISELEFMGFANPDTAYLVSALKKQSDGTYDLYETDAVNFAVNLPRIPVADVNVTVSVKGGAFSKTIVFTPDNFSVAQSIPLAAALVGVDAAKLTIAIASDDPTYNAVIDTINYGLVFGASLSSPIDADTTVTGTLSVRNLLVNAPKTVNAYAALYNDNGAMADLYSQQLTIPADGVNLTVTKAFSIPAGAENYFIKAFFWDTNYVPYVESFKFAQ